MARKPLIALVAVPLLVVACSHRAPAPSEPFRAHGTIHASELPPRLLASYRLQMQAPEPKDGSYYRAGDLDTVLTVFPTPDGPVFIDGGGGGMAYAESCTAMSEFARANGWISAIACLDGDLAS